MSLIVEDYLRTVETNLKVDTPRRQEILRELRGHLYQEIEDKARAEPDRPREDIAREVLRGFGSPHDLAVAYEGERTVLKSTTSGQTLLKVGRAVGRGAGKTLKWIAISLAFLLVLGLVAGIWAYYEFKPIAQRNIPYPVYDYSKTCGVGSCGGLPEEDSFLVHDGAREVRMDLTVHPEDTNTGTVRITVRDPGGATKWEQTFTPASGSSTHREVKWGVAVGDWKITYDYVGFQGIVDVEILAIGLPRDAT